MVSALVSGSSGPGSSPGRGTLCCAHAQGTLLFREPLHPGALRGRGNPAMS